MSSSMEPRARLDGLRQRGLLSLDQYLDELEKLHTATAATDHAADRSEESSTPRLATVAGALPELQGMCHLKGPRVSVCLLFSS